MAEVTQVLLIRPALVLGVILGLYELIAIHADMNFRGSHWLGHGAHAIIFMIIALFATLNTGYFLEVTGLAAKSIPFISSPLLVRIAIGIILNLKIHSASAIARGGAGLAARGLAEHWTHTIIVSALVVAAPYYWPVLAGVLPVWIQ
jgi:hypothetical protein